MLAYVSLYSKKNKLSTATVIDLFNLLAYNAKTIAYEIMTKSKLYRKKNMINTLKKAVFISKI